VYFLQGAENNSYQIFHLLSYQGSECHWCLR
jgi:hypothetical protein